MNRLLFSLALLAFLSFPTPAFSDDPLATLYSRQGSVEGRVAPSPSYAPIDINQSLQERDAVRTQENSRAGILFNDGFLVRLNEETVLEMKSRNAASNEQDLSLAQGVAYFFSRDPKKFPKVDTPVVSAAVRGTEFVVRASATETTISVLQGQVECSNQYGSVQLSSGEESYTAAGKAPIKRIMVRPLDAVEWALYYPALLDLSDYSDLVGGADAPQKEALEAIKANDLVRAQTALASASPSDWRTAMLKSMVAYQDGDLDGAFAALTSAPKQHGCDLSLFASALYLSVGDVQRAESLLAVTEQCLAASSAPHANVRAAALSQRALLSLTKNDRSTAQSLSQQALTTSPSSLSALLVNSYVAQGSFDLDSATESIEQALLISPHHPFVLARKAELALSYGKLDEAEQYISEATAIAPHNQLVLTVRGFVELTRYRTESAIATFQEAIKSDPTSGLPHLGLGLALIRDGHLAEGRNAIERAVHLEPQVAIYRSYLGKAFFEEEREDLSEKEYARAIALDPNDPTPYLYRATLNLSKFRPVEALDDIEDSIRLNDNRAVYRSSLLLDQDLAVRGANLAETFTKLGFTEAARIEAIKSLNRNYSNYSAHYLLAGSYGNSPLFGEALITENLLGGLLAPVNFNSILPNFGGDAALNEYTALFDRPTHRTRMDGVLISHDKTAIGEVADLGAAHGFAYSVSYQGGYRNGPYQNDTERTHFSSLNTNFQLTDQDSLQLFNGIAFSDRGDRFMPLTSSLIDNDYNEDLDLFVTRAGFHHQFSQESHLLFQYAFSNQHVHTTDGLEDRVNVANLISEGEILDAFSFIQTINEDYRQRFRGSRYSGQYILDRDLFSLVLGADTLNSTAKQNEDSTGIGLDEDEQETTFPVFSRGTHAEDSSTFYLYPTLHFGEYVDINLGISYADLTYSQDTSEPPFTGGSSPSNAWNPKAGISLYVTPQTTLRAAYFENSGVAGSLDREALEPTIVGGFNQLYDDILGATRSQSLGFGVDHKFPKSTYLGSEFVTRDVTQSQRYVNTIFNVDIDAEEFEFDRQLIPGADDLHATENLVRSYLYQVIDSGITATLDHTYSEFEPADLDTLSHEVFSEEIRTHKLKLGLNFVDTSGFVTFGGATWRQQGLSGFDDPIDGERDFWIAEWGFAYLFPHRRGSVVLNFNNLLDQEFHYFPTSLESGLISGFNIGLGVSVNF